MQSRAGDGWKALNLCANRRDLGTNSLVGFAEGRARTKPSSGLDARKAAVRAAFSLHLVF
jgi:hypothetical protein